MKPLYKTEIVIWTEEDPSDNELEDLARRATVGDAFCSHQRSILVADPEQDMYPPAQDFFWQLEDEDE